MAKRKPIFEWRLWCLRKPGSRERGHGMCSARDSVFEGRASSLSVLPIGAIAAHVATPAPELIPPPADRVPRPVLPLDKWPRRTGIPESCHMSIRESRTRPASLAVDVTWWVSAEFSQARPRHRKKRAHRGSHLSTVAQRHLCSTQPEDNACRMTLCPSQFLRCLQHSDTCFYLKCRLHAYL